MPILQGTVDIQTMFAMSDEDYKIYVFDVLLFVDHHGVLREDIYGIPLAATKEQVEILFDVIKEKLYPSMLTKRQIEKGS